VLARDVMTTVVTISTETRMRADGVLKFEVVYDQREGVTPKAIKMLEKQLGDLKDYKKTSDSNTALREGESGDWEEESHLVGSKSGRCQGFEERFTFTH
jgi:hypothetical protein